MTGALNKGLGFGDAGTGTGWQFLGRTATAGVVGGTATAISGGKFGNGAVTAAFMHVVNDEVVGKLEVSLAEDQDRSLWEIEKSGGKTIILVDRADPKGGPDFWDSAERYGVRIDISKENWGQVYSAAVGKFGGAIDRVLIVDHGASWNYGGQQFGDANLTIEQLKFLAAPVKNGVVFCGCAIGAKSKQFDTLHAMARAIPGKSLVGYSELVFPYGKNKNGVSLGLSTRSGFKGGLSRRVPSIATRRVAMVD